MTIRRAFRDSVTNETPLAGELIDEPWRDYQLGQGIDALTGQFANRAVNDFKVTDFGSYDVYWTYAKVSSDSEYKQLFRAELSGSYNTDGIKASGSAAFLSHVSYSSTSMTLVILYDIESNGYGTPSPAPSLTPQAAKKAAEHPTDFRNDYGDYFVANMTAGARFAATYTCSASNSASLLDFKAAAEASSDALSAKGAVAFEQKAKASNISVSCKVFMHGINKIHPPFGASPTAMADAFAWFIKADEQGLPVNLSFVPRRALFTHYSQLAPLPRTLPVDPGIFSQIKSLADQISEVTTLFSRLPDYYKTVPYPGGGTYGERVTFLERDFENSKGTFPEHPEGMGPLIDLANQLLNFIRPQLSLFSFYKTLRDTPPPEGEGSSETGKYGYYDTTPSGVSVQIKVAQNEYYQPNSGYPHKHTFSWPFDKVGPDQIVVGWEIHNGYGEYNGSWRCYNTIIGRSSGQVHIWGEWGRSTSWWMNVWYVLKSEFPWLQSGDEEHEPEQVLASQP